MSWPLLNRRRLKLQARRNGMEQIRRAEWERTMKVQEVILRAMAKKITWWQAAEILGISNRTMRRWKWRYEHDGFKGLLDGRKGRPSWKRVPTGETERILGLYRDKYFDLNVRHFYEKVTTEHGVTLSYTWVKNLLQGAGLVKKNRDRQRHRKRRPRRPIPGMLLHIDGSHHQWFQDDRWLDLLVILDDATSEIYYAQLVEDESTRTVMRALRDVIERKGLFCALYSDRASHFFYTPKAQQRVNQQQPTQVGRAMNELGIQTIPAYSPQARGRSERSFGTWQGRLPQELRLRGIVTLEAANTFLHGEYIHQFNSRFTVTAAQPGTAFVPLRHHDLDRIFSIQHERTVNNDNTVRIGNVVLQIEPTAWRSTLARCHVMIQERLDGTLVVSYGPHVVGRYTLSGQPIAEMKVSSKAKRSKKSAVKRMGADFFVKTETAAARSTPR
jgi:transposase